MGHGRADVVEGDGGPDDFEKAWEQADLHADRLRNPNRLLHLLGRGAVRGDHDSMGATLANRPTEHAEGIVPGPVAVEP